MVKKIINYKEKLIGSLVALITPMDINGKIDYLALQKLLKLHYTSGTTGIVLLGTTGESPTVTIEERNLILDHVLKVEKPNNIALILGIGGNSTLQVAEQIHSLKREHREVLDAILSVVPYYNKPTQNGLFQHFNYLAEVSTLPIILYNVPSRTVTDLLPETVIKLAQNKNIIGIKDASGDIARVKIFLENCKQEFSLLSGNDDSSLEFVKAGGDGVISVVGNAYPEQIATLFNAYRKGNKTTANMINGIFEEMQKMLFIEANPIPIKWLMAKKFGICNKLRLPLTELDYGNQVILKQAMDKVEKKLLSLGEV